MRGSANRNGAWSLGSLGNTTASSGVPIERDGCITPRGAYRGKKYTAWIYPHLGFRLPASFTRLAGFAAVNHSDNLARCEFEMDGYETTRVE